MEGHQVGQVVEAYTYPDPDRELGPYRVEGPLTVRYVDVWDYDQHIVTTADGPVVVDPATVRPLPEGE